LRRGWVGEGAELLLGLHVAEGVQEGDAALEGRLGGGSTGDGEVDVSELFGVCGCVVVVMVVFHPGHVLCDTDDG